MDLNLPLLRSIEFRLRKLNDHQIVNALRQNTGKHFRRALNNEIERRGIEIF